MSGPKRVSGLLLGPLVGCLVVVVLGYDLKAFDDTVLFKINWPGKTGADLLVSVVLQHVELGGYRLGFWCVIVGSDFGETYVRYWGSVVCQWAS